eukprot:Pgem_evm1s15053
MMFFKSIATFAVLSVALTASAHPQQIENQNHIALPNLAINTNFYHQFDYDRLTRRDIDEGVEDPVLEEFFKSKAFLTSPLHKLKIVQLATGKIEPTKELLVPILQTVFKDSKGFDYEGTAAKVVARFKKEASSKSDEDETPETLESIGNAIATYATSEAERLQFAFLSDTLDKVLQSENTQDAQNIIKNDPFIQKAYAKLAKQVAGATTLESIKKITKETQTTAQKKASAATSQFNQSKQKVTQTNDSTKMIASSLVLAGIMMTTQFFF